MKKNIEHILFKFVAVSLLLALVFLQSCGSDEDGPEEPMVVGPPQIEQLMISRDTVWQDPINILEGSRVTFNYINEFGMPGAPTDTDTLYLEVLDLRSNFTDLFLLYNGRNLSQVSFIDGKVSFQSPGTCCIIDGASCMNWPDTFQEVNYEILVTNQNGESTDKMNYRLIINCED